MGAVHQACPVPELGTGPQNLRTLPLSHNESVNQVQNSDNERLPGEQRPPVVTGTDKPMWSLVFIRTQIVGFRFEFVKALPPAQALLSGPHV